MSAIITKNAFTPETLKPFLADCGYQLPLLVTNYRFGAASGVRDVDLAAFAHQPADIRSACVAAIRANGDPAQAVMSYRELGAPVVFVCREEQLQWWRQGTQTPEHLKTVTATELAGFFRTHQQDFAPQTIYRAKTRGRFASGDQLAFVDAGLLPLVEEEIGTALSGLVERIAGDLRARLQPAKMTVTFGQWLFRSVFWLLAAKILRDKNVASFRTLDLTNVEEVFARIATYYGSSLPSYSLTPAEQEALVAASHTLAQFSHLGHVTTEAFAKVYETTLVTRETRAKLGIHSTPSYLVDYIVWRLSPWIEEMPAVDRHIFEPACGPAAFLVSAMRLLKELLPPSLQTSGEYLRQRLHGIDIDAFAIEIARLAMTLADLPNPDDWDVQCTDMFVGGALEHFARQSMVLLANPPFENFKKADREQYRQQGVGLTYVNKATEMLSRTLPHLRPGAVFGIVVPQGFLYNIQAAALRAFMTRNFEIAEICLFPDKIFTFSDMESAILLGRRTRKPRLAAYRVHYRQVREPDVTRFREAYVATTDRWVPQMRFVSDPASILRIPELEEVWEWCRHMPRFGQLARIVKGLDYKGQNKLPTGAQTLSPYQFPGAVRGFARITPDLRTDGQPPEVWMSVNPTVIGQPRAGTTVGVPQVLLNYARVSRSPWRLKAVIDRQGHAVTSRFLTVRPVSATPALEFFWALCNSPFANAYIYTHSDKRDVLAGVMRAMPVPSLLQDGVQRVVEAVHAYFNAVALVATDVLSMPFDADNARTLLMRIDAEILRLYELPPRLERQLLDLFSGRQRPGVPFTFERYFPKDFEPCFPLHVYLSESYQRSTVGAVRVRYIPVTDPAILAALERAMQDFAE